MDRNAVVAMMARMGITPQDLQNMGQPPFNQGATLSGPRRPPPFEPDLSSDELKRRFEQFDAWAEYDRTLDPVQVPFENPASLVHEFEELHRSITANFHSPENSTRTSITGFGKHSSKLPLDQLTIIYLSEMLVRKVHKGRFLLCRSITTCTRLVGVQMLVEDPEGRVRDLAIYNFPTLGMGSSPEDVAAIFPLGTILAIREPTLKMPSQGYRPIIRVDSPSDVIFIEPHSKLALGTTWKTGSRVNRSAAIPSSADAWKARGNGHFKAGRWLAAVFSYSSGMEMDPSAYLLRLNRAEAFLRLEYYSASQRDAEQVLGLSLEESARRKALSRAGRAYYGKQDYVGAEKMFAGWLESQPGDPDALAWIARCRLRLQESTTGDYDWVRLSKESQVSPHIDAANYVGPIRVSEMIDRGGGRGVVATRDISSGELLVAAKPFASAFNADFPPPQKEVLISFDTLAKRALSRNQAAVLSRATQKLYGNPDMYNSVFDLYGGTAYETPLSYPPTAQESHRFPKSFPFFPATDFDITQLESICSHNVFSPYDTQVPDHPDSPEDSPDRPAALYLLPSLFNHACCANATWFSIGDFIVIRARALIRAGEELTLSYTYGQTPYQQRQSRLKNWLIAGCDCALCDEDRRDGASTRERREKLISQVKVAVPLVRLRALVQDISTAYSPTRGALRPDMWHVYHTLGETLRLREYSTYLTESIKAEFDALQSVGVRVVDKTMRGAIPRPRELPIATGEFFLPSVIMLDQYVLTLITIAYAFSKMPDLARTSRWLKTAISAHGVAFGGEKPYFMHKFSTFLGHVGLLRTAQAMEM
ncbi:hypothetical protein PLICRDRAFT_178965 [Plicaturopsis crispa FD-325 SS-3]|uniref:SET domain-containing protein n=1 Tax=Plicaturopsis crispa FD-325 SS-3 TaxID=944288 RepID=A0A0C9SLC1_PLICR|nr:hypothetical protein PLICRDRAFT_178965 [Plicaturopsis crispa FD-325 SS-3]